MSSGNAKEATVDEKGNVIPSPGDTSPGDARVVFYKSSQCA